MLAGKPIKRQSQSVVIRGIIKLLSLHIGDKQKARAEARQLKAIQRQVSDAEMQEILRGYLGTFDQAELEQLFVVNTE